MHTRLWCFWIHLASDDGDLASVVRGAQIGGTRSIVWTDEVAEAEKQIAAESFDVEREGGEHDLACSR